MQDSEGQGSLGNRLTKCKPIQVNSGVSETLWRGVGEGGLDGQTLMPLTWKEHTFRRLLSAEESTMKLLKLQRVDSSETIVLP